MSRRVLEQQGNGSIVCFSQLFKALQLKYMWQSRVEIEDYSVIIIVGLQRGKRDLVTMCLEFQQNDLIG